jgi:hypothetical protein
LEQPVKRKMIKASEPVILYNVIICFMVMLFNTKI